MNATDNHAHPVFHHTFRLATGSGNTCTQPVLAILQENGFLRWHHVPAKWVRPPSERDKAEWRDWVEQSANSARQLADEFYFEH